MNEQAIRQGDDSFARGLHMSQQGFEQMGAFDNAGGATTPERRITADSFRLLSARLRKKPIAASLPVIPDVFVLEPAPEPIVVSLAPVEPEPVVHIVEEAPVSVFEDVAAEAEVEAFAPQVDVLPEPSVFETALDVVEEKPFEEPFVEETQVFAEAHQREEILAAVEPEPALEFEPTPAPEPEAIEATTVIDSLEDIKPAPVEEITVQGIGEIAKAIYMTPTPTDRAEFLAECAAMAAAEAEAEAEAKRTQEEPADFVQPQPVSAKPRLRRVSPLDDPFAKVVLEHAEQSETIVEADEDSGELARSLLDMMLSSPNAGLPQERALAADALLKLVPRIPMRALVAIVERVSIMESPPHLLVSKLINDPRIEVSGPLLEHCNHISDQVLSKVVATGQISLQRLIARRRQISAALADQLIQFDDPSVILTLVRNAGVTVSHNAFSLLAKHVVNHPSALAPFATRADLPAPTAFELYWFVPAELRRYILSRFLTDSETLTKILKITQTMQNGETTGDVKFPETEQIEAVVKLLLEGNMQEAAEKLAEVAGIQLDTATRITNDREGEPFAIVFKAMGANRARFAEIVQLFKTSDYGIIRGEREVEELSNVFDSMSFNKARILLTYWDWSSLKSGPYAPAN
jgi:uncharacterized protein (DUF2336 family)